MLKFYDTADYDKILQPKFNEEQVVVLDHLDGFSKDLYNPILQKLNGTSRVVSTQYIPTEELQKRYSNIELKFFPDFYIKLFSQFANYRQHPVVEHKNLLCSFNGTSHVGRQLLVSILKNQGLFNPESCSKNFITSNETVTGHLHNLDLTTDEIELYDKFFNNFDKFNQQLYSFGHERFDHKNNIYNLENKLTQSFVHIVSETVSTSYQPFVTEKFLYSVVTRGLFLAYAQPGWHAHLEKYYGFKLYDKIFDYSFDSIDNPVKRLVKLIEMISKFKTLSSDDWRDLYFVLEKDTIEFNYDHYFSKQYLKYLKKFDNTDLIDADKGI